MSAHTPGPWRWELNEKSKTLQLCGGRSPFDLTVMDFVRWGMGSAVARFRDDVDGMNIMNHTVKWASIAPGREHHAEWFKLVSHPDADLIAAAPELLIALEAARAEHGKSVLFGSDALRLMESAIAKARGGK